jgi:hypothetical protein
MKCVYLRQLLYFCSSSDLKQRYHVTGIPTVIVVGRDGQLISRSGRSEITEQGPAIFQTWLAATKAS